MKYLITEKVIGFVARKFDGKKTMIGGVGMILLGLVGLMGHFWPDMGLPVMEFDVAAGYVVAGFAALGLGGKLEKIGMAGPDQGDSCKGDSRKGDSRKGDS